MPNQDASNSPCPRCRTWHSDDTFSGSATVPACDMPLMNREVRHHGDIMPGLLRTAGPHFGCVDSVNARMAVVRGAR